MNVPAHQLIVARGCGTCVYLTLSITIKECWLLSLCIACRSFSFPPSPRLPPPCCYRYGTMHSRTLIMYTLLIDTRIVFPVQTGAVRSVYCTSSLPKSTVQDFSITITRTRHTLAASGSNWTTVQQQVVHVFPLKRVGRSYW